MNKKEPVLNPNGVVEITRLVTCLTKMGRKVPVLNPNGVVEIAVDNMDLVPVIIGKQVDELDKLDRKVKSALSKATKAHKRADLAKEKSAGLFKKKAAIEALQEAGYALSEAVVSAAEAQRIAFEFQTKLAEISKSLFVLGVQSIAHNRMAVRELQLRLKGASATKLSEMARKEVLNVIRQLKAQEDIMSKQEMLTKKVKTHNDQLIVQIEKDKLHDEQLQQQVEKDEQHDTQLRNQIEMDKQHDEELSKLRERCIKLETQYKSLDESQKTLQECIYSNEHGIRRQEESHKQQHCAVSDAVAALRKRWYISSSVALIALIGTIVLYFFSFH